MTVSLGAALVRYAGLWTGDQAKGVPLKTGDPGLEFRLGGALVRDESSGLRAGLGPRAGLRLLTRGNFHGRPRCWSAGKFSR